MSDDLKARIDALADAIEKAFDGGLLPRYGLTAHQILREARDRIEGLERESSSWRTKFEQSIGLYEDEHRAEAACREVIRECDKLGLGPVRDAILAAARAGLPETKP